jgi:hypothetical protein
MYSNLELKSYKLLAPREYSGKGEHHVKFSRFLA